MFVCNTKDTVSNLAHDVSEITKKLSNYTVQIDCNRPYEMEWLARLLDYSSSKRYTRWERLPNVRGYGKLFRFRLIYIWLSNGINRKFNIWINGGSREYWFVILFDPLIYIISLSRYCDVYLDNVFPFRFVEQL